MLLAIGRLRIFGRGFRVSGISPCFRRTLLILASTASSSPICSSHDLWMDEFPFEFMIWL